MKTDIKKNMSMAIVGCVVLGLISPARAQNDDCRQEIVGNVNDTRVSTKCGLAEKAVYAFRNQKWREGYALAMNTDCKSAKVQYYLGICYFSGYGGVRRDHDKAKECWCKAVLHLREAALQGNDAEAQFLLGQCYAIGRGVKRDKIEAVKWYFKAAEQGHAVAQFHLGEYFYFGDVFEKDFSTAWKWFGKAIKRFRNGDADAQFWLGFCYSNGRGVAEDKSKAITYYLKAAEQGHMEAQYYTGNCYRFGDGVEQNDDEAVKWWSKAAKEGYKQAQDVLRKHNLAW